MLTSVKNVLSNFNKTVYFDTYHLLREKTRDTNIVQQCSEQLIGFLKGSLNRQDEYFIKGALGNLYRINGETKKAIHYLTFCLQYARECQDTSKEIVSLIRLGEALKYSDDHQGALNNFNQALERSQSDNIENYVDFVQQHKGKCLMEMTGFDEAESCFLEAF
ncbi:tetratricopeptide repeat protein [Marinilactibacillus sp. GCM10026970]|uniref:tetratricopeptide repeat protein n=1 Tax=unclassified Marinilactibacillus TaxID=2632303 RepID=UPI001CE3C178|nr:tetratricopeptide repeat protein [Marinilactibacillus sp. Marseille-P9653]